MVVVRMCTYVSYCTWNWHFHVKEVLRTPLETAVGIRFGQRQCLEQVACKVSVMLLCRGSQDNVNSLVPCSFFLQVTQHAKSRWLMHLKDFFLGDASAPHCHFHEEANGCRHTMAGYVHERQCFQHIQGTSSTIPPC